MYTSFVKRFLLFSHKNLGKNIDKYSDYAMQYLFLLKIFLVWVYLLFFYFLTIFVKMVVFLKILFTTPRNVECSRHCCESSIILQLVNYWSVTPHYGLGFFRLMDFQKWDPQTSQQWGKPWPRAQILTKTIRLGSPFNPRRGLVTIFEIMAQK